MLHTEINPTGFPVIPGVEVKRLIKEIDEGKPEAPKPERKPARKFACRSGKSIMNTEYAELRWTVPGYLPEGLSILAGRQKLGKTWLALDFAVAVATGGLAMGAVPCQRGDVLYIDLENGERRIQRRLKTMFPGDGSTPDLGRLEFTTESPDLGPEFLAACDDWRLSCDRPALIVVDVLQRIKPAGSMARNAYENDYSTISSLQAWATRHGVSVLVLHHTRKGGADDPLEALSGSNGLSACADTTLVLDRDGNGVTLYVRGRDVEEQETALRFDGGLWSILGAASEVRRTDERQEILSVLIEADESLSPRDISVATSMPRNNVDQLLFKMGKAGEVLKAGRGRYIHPKRTDLIDAQPSTPGKSDKEIRNGDDEEGREGDE
ncbi:AAA family ATPase [Pleomorphomonas sp. JP5]|uniref:AAA family ATPase n=1 Tax=Pleomorphomonas sp. JP5 TaxID=2942998 RepID=UPI0020444CF6|nr:AAA family ATPase [Pleomorphomonas sp. JP5]MCM5558083.1 helicase RepA family protein [Pleomorphomonas sp. JP5]